MKNCSVSDLYFSNMRLLTVSVVIPSPYLPFCQVWGTVREMKSEILTIHKTT